ncbi:MAG: class I SAM-dependent methyltransferase [Spirochaetales bacterium]|nr:class I SAM-dependent methyltransferase [Spirochaetales bacterium]
MGKILLKDNIPVGNLDDKYTTRNPIGKYFIQKFLTTVTDIIMAYKEDINSITEVGCGEGYILNAIYSVAPGITMRACDFSEEIIEIARTLFPLLDFYVKSIYDIGQEDRADLIVCCEVLEHLEFPEKALKKLAETTNKYCLLTVPTEPLWRILNMARGKYIHDFGNTPGHIQHWTYHQFINLVRSRMDIIATKFVVPWTVVLCKKK